MESFIINKEAKYFMIKYINNAKKKNKISNSVKVGKPFVIKGRLGINPL